MSKDIIFSGQNFLDKVIECTGSIENAFEMAIANQISITDYLKVGYELEIIPPTNKSVALFFSVNNRPATGTTNNNLDMAFAYEFAIGF